MTVVAVGDFDPKRMEADVKQRFARIPAVAKPRDARVRAGARPRGDATSRSSRTRSIRAPGSPSLWLGAPKRTRTTADYRRSLVNGLHDRMVSARLSEISQRPDAPFAYGGIGTRLVHPHARRPAAVRRREGKRLREGRGRAPRRGGAGAPVRLHRDRAGSRAHELPAWPRAALRGARQDQLERLRRPVRLERTQRDAHREHRRRAEARAALRADGHARRAQRARPRLLPQARIASSSWRPRTSPRSSCLREPRCWRCSIARPTRRSRRTWTRRRTRRSSPTPPTPGKVVSETKLPETGILEWTPLERRQGPPQAERLQARRGAVRRAEPRWDLAAARYRRDAGRARQHGALRRRTRHVQPDLAHQATGRKARRA